ncbi:hypothetical protein Tco_1261819, partial [Tanacetum coccineum]
DPTTYLYYKYLFFLKPGNTKVRKYLLSLHKIHAISFPEDDLEEVLKSKTRSDPDEVFSNKNIAEIIRVIYHDAYGHEQIDEKFSDATLKRVVWKISVINVEAKHEILKISLSKQDKELMALLEEEIEERLKYLR